MDIDEKSSFFTLFLKKDFAYPSVSNVKDMLDASGYDYEISYTVDNFYLVSKWNICVTIHWDSETSAKYVIYLAKTNIDLLQLHNQNFNNNYFAFSKRAEFDEVSKGLWELGIITDIQYDPLRLLHLQYRLI
jgi:hypothetical protein